MPFSKGLARLNSFALAFILLFQAAFLPVPAMAKTRKGDKLVKDAQIAEAKGDYEKALSLYEQALGEDPRDTGYKLGLDRLRFQAAQKIVDRGEKIRAQGNLEEALALFQKAFALDPASAIAEQRMRQTYEAIKKEKERQGQGQGAPPPEERGMNAADRVRKENERKLETLMDAPELRPIKREIVNLKMNNQPVKVLFETLAKMAGVNVMFDPDFVTQNSGRNYPVDFQNTTLEEALDYLSILTKAYWKPLSANAIYVTLDNPQKRRDYEDFIVKIFYLQHALDPQELNEMANAVRVVGECRKVVPYPAQMAIMVRCTQDQISLVQKIVNDMDKPRSEIVLDVFVLEANRTKTRSLAATIANGTSAGLNQVIGFTPRSDLTIPSTSTGTGTTPTTTTSTAIRLANIGRISANDFSVNLPGGYLQALLEDRTTRVLQNPQIRTVDNKKASLRIGDRYPYATGSFNVGATGGVGGGFNPIASTQFQFAEVGVNVDITPKIHGNEEISLRVEVEVSNIRDQVDIGGVRQPVIGQRKIGEDIRIREGEINVMGGLMSTSSSRNLRGLPGLVTLPGLGWLFGTDGKDQAQSELLIVLVPHLVRAPEVTDLNLRGVSTGTDQQVKITYQTKEVRAPAPPPPASAPPGSPPATAAPVVVPVSPPSTVPQAVPPQATPPQAFNPNSNLAASVMGRPMTTQLPAGMVPATKNKLVLTPQQEPVYLSAPLKIVVNLESAADLTRAPIRIDYDRQLLKLISVKPAGLLSADGVKENLNVDLGKGEVEVSRAEGATGVNGSGALLELTFVSLAKGEAAVRVADAKFVDSKKTVSSGFQLPEVVVKIQ
jgi:general secretion pathway protein D